VRRGCRLCDAAAHGVHRAARLAGLAVRTVDIETDDRLIRDYGMRIPVVLVDGRVIAEGAIEPVRLWVGLVGARLRA
jgi:hypothetical protein